MAGTASRSSMEMALEELICPMCMDTFKEPRSLGCLHSYCENCLLGLQETSVAPDTVVCPECRAKTGLLPAGVSGRLANIRIYIMCSFSLVVAREV